MSISDDDRYELDWGGEAHARPLVESQRFPLLVQPARGSPELAPWAAERRELLDAALLKHGALLFRGFEVKPETGFPDFLSGVSRGGLLDYVYRSTPRTSVGTRVFTATEYPANASIPPHCENAYQRDWPMKLAFHCVVAARQGGETPLADVVRVTARLGRERLERYEPLGVMYVRNYGMGADLPWQTVFQTQDPKEVERFCREHDIQFEWRPRGGLRTRQVCQAVATHPVTRERLWFNQAHLFHVSSLEPKARKAMLAVFKEEELPRNAYLGDGRPLDPAELDFVREAFAQETVAFSWQAGDVLLVDNMQLSHARNPFEGPRRVLVAMSEPCSAVRAALSPDGSRPGGGAVA